MHVAICCITFRRPDGLQRLLDGLNELTFRKNPEPTISVIVVDNDGTAPMRALVDARRPGFRWSLRYVCEPVRGVSSARNRALDSVPADADCIAWIDDDEVPVPGWLDELLYVRGTYGASIVQGPVFPHFLSPPPRWLVQGRFLELGPYRDGASLHYAYSGNSLIDVAVVRQLRMRFDPRFDRTGGEDQRFFGCAIAAGHGVITAEHAVVHEWVPASRATLRYLLRRRFRMGTTLAMIDRIEGGRRRLAMRAFKGVGRIGLGLAQTATVFSHGRAGLAMSLCTMAWGAGALAGLIGVTHHEYDGPVSEEATGHAAVLVQHAGAEPPPKTPYSPGDQHAAPCSIDSIGHQFGKDIPPAGSAEPAESPQTRSALQSEPARAHHAKGQSGGADQEVPRVGDVESAQDGEVDGRADQKM